MKLPNLLRLLTVALLTAAASPAHAAYLGNGVKTGAVHQDQAVFWARITAEPEMKQDGATFTKTKDRGESVLRLKEDAFAGQIPQGKELADMAGALRGAAGEVRFAYYPSGASHQAVSTEWMPVDPESNFIRQHRATGLKPGTGYTLITEARKPGAKSASDRIEGRFRTAPEASSTESTRFVVVTCGDYPRRDDPQNGHVIYQTMLKADPDFFVHTGDIEYYDKPDPWAINQELARFKWDRLFALPYIRDFHNEVTSYFMKDDHDTTKNDAWPGQDYGNLTWENGLRIFREQFPSDGQAYRRVRWGQHLEVWMMEGRDFRSPNRMDDGPEKTIWGAEQKAWLFKTFAESDATYRILISPTPIVGPDRENKNDNHANKGFTHEGDEIRAFLSKQDNAFVICGDRHWQYHSIHPDTGVHEFSCGPSSDIHAGGYREEFQNEYHQYLNIRGGYLSVEVEGDMKPTITFRHHAPSGEVQYAKSFQ